MNSPKACLSESTVVLVTLIFFCTNCICVFLQHLSYGNGNFHVDAAFQQTFWSVVPICTRSEVAQGASTLHYIYLHVYILRPIHFELKKIKIGVFSSVHQAR